MRRAIGRRIVRRVARAGQIQNYRKNSRSQRSTELIEEWQGALSHGIMGIVVIIVT